MNDGIKLGFKEIHKFLEKGKPVRTNGGEYVIENVGTYGTNYLARAFMALYGLGANLPEDAVYPKVDVSATGKMLNANYKYALHFAKNELPPAKAFWSLILYDQRGFLVKNPINRYVIRESDPLQYNKDGSLDIYIQARSPSKDKVANWLPTPRKGEFNLILRLYWPKQSVLDGKWEIPPIKTVK